MEINNIGNNAGVIWNALNANGKMTEAKLKKESGLASADFTLHSDGSLVRASSM